MSRHVLSHSQLSLVRDPEPVVSVAPAEPPVEPSPEVERKDWYFVKNMNPRETIILADGEKFNFPSQVFFTKDKILADKILAVADRYHIALQS